jgi:hypothetical protein
MSLSQALLLAINMALSEDGALSDDEWKPFDQKVREVQSQHEMKHDEAKGTAQHKATPSTRRSSRGIKGGGGQYDSLPLATVSAMLDMAPSKLVPILNGLFVHF